MTQKRIVEDKSSRQIKRTENEREKQRQVKSDVDKPDLKNLQQTIGNRAVQRLLVQRSGEGAFDLDDETADRINQERGGGQTLEPGMKDQMSESLGIDLSDIRIHSSSAAHELNEDLDAKAFTTGQDIFFREGAYNPHSSDGQELIAHELTHVVQQASGIVRGGGEGKMTVNAPGDTFEQEAETVAKEAIHPSSEASVQRQAIPEEEEEEMIQTQPLEEEEEMIQAQPMEEEEEMIQAQPMEEEEEMIQAQEMEEEEELYS